MVTYLGKKERDHLSPERTYIKICNSLQTMERTEPYRIVIEALEKHKKRLEQKYGFTESMFFDTSDMVLEASK